SEKRPEAWRQLPKNLKEAAERLGGLVGTVEIVGCRKYETDGQFAVDVTKHRVPIDWFEPVMYGFELTAPQPIEFEPCKGDLYFFRAPEPPPPSDAPRLFE
ncbi:MAG: hypothetical protein ACRDD1_14100, partial [Planctomycetia bacterium]